MVPVTVDKVYPNNWGVTTEGYRLVNSVPKMFNIDIKDEEYVDLFLSENNEISNILIRILNDISYFLKRNIKKFYVDFKIKGENFLKSYIKINIFLDSLEDAISIDNFADGLYDKYEWDAVDKIFLSPEFVNE